MDYFCQLVHFRCVLLAMRGLIGGFHMTCYAACTDANLQEFMPEGRRTGWVFLTVEKKACSKIKVAHCSCIL